MVAIKWAISAGELVGYETTKAEKDILAEVMYQYYLTDIKTIYSNKNKKHSK